MDNPEKTGTKGHTRWRQTKQKHNTICVGHHYAQTNTNTVNETWALLQTTGGHARRTEHCWNTLSVLLSNEMTFPK